MDFLEKLNYLMERDNLNKNTLSKACDIPYTTIDGWYKKGYEGLKLTTLRKLAKFFGTSLDFWASDQPFDSMNKVFDVLKCDANYLFQDAFEGGGEKLSSEELKHIKKYRATDDDGRRIIDMVLDDQIARITAKDAVQDFITHKKFYYYKSYLQPVSAGTGQYNDDESAEEITLTKPAPYGTDYLAPISGDSMEPDYHDGDLVFVQAQNIIRVGEVGIFEHDGDMFIKELGDGKLLSLNENYKPIPLDETYICQGKVLGVCSDEYFNE